MGGRPQVLHRNLSPASGERPVASCSLNLYERVCMLLLRVIVSASSDLAALQGPGLDGQQCQDAGVMSQLIVIARVQMHCICAQ